MKIKKYNIKEVKNLQSIFTSRIIKNSQWYEKSWGGVLAPLFIVGYNAIVLGQRISNTFKFAMIFVKDDKMSWFWDMRDLIATRKKILKLYILKPKSIEKWLDDWKKEWRTFLSIFHNLETIDLRSLSDRQLFNWYKKIRDSYVLTNSLPYLADSFLSVGEKDWLVELVIKEFKHKEVI